MLPKWTWTTWLAFLLVLLGLILLIVFSLSSSFNDWSWVLKPELANNFGGLVGGVIGSIFSLAGIFLLYETIIKQQKLFNLQQFESKFFELVRYHRENVEKMKYRLPLKSEEEYVEGAAFFVEVVSEIEELYKKISRINQEFDEEKIIEISVQVHYFGVSKTILSTLKSALSNYDSKAIEKIIDKLRTEKTKYDSKIVRYGGHQHRLGHYLRHLSQIVTLADTADFLDQHQKEGYVNFLRAQLTEYELKFFFYNSLSRYGKNWEQKGYITKYKLIKNLPQELSNGIEPKKYYNKFKYNWES